MSKLACDVRNPVGDGNCLYACLVSFLYGVVSWDVSHTPPVLHMYRVMQLRQDCCAYLSQHRNDFYGLSGLTLSSVMIDHLGEIKGARREAIRKGLPWHTCDARLDVDMDPVDQYLEFMMDATPGRCEWGTHVEIYAYSKMYACNVLTYEDLECDVGNLGVYFEVLMARRSVPTNLKTVCLLFDGSHFQALVRKENTVMGEVLGLMRDVEAGWTEDDVVTTRTAFLRFRSGSWSRDEFMAHLNSLVVKKLLRPYDPVAFQRGEGVRMGCSGNTEAFVGGDSALEKGPRRKRPKAAALGMKVSKEEHRIKLAVEQRFSYQSISDADKSALLKRKCDTKRKRYRENLEESRSKSRAEGRKYEQKWETARKKYAAGLERRCANAKAKRGKLVQKGLVEECASVGMEYDEPESVIGVECSNCRRRRLLPLEDSSYYDVRLKQVKSSKIFAVQSKLRMVRATKRGCREYEYWLCRQCCMFLKKREGARDADEVMDWRYTWPAFFWNLLSGSQCDNDVHFYEVYEPSFLWRFVPVSLRPYWVEAICGVGHGVYAGCMVESPSSFFVDRTADLREFSADIAEHTLEGLLRALLREGRKSMILPDVLCPWGCSDFSFHGHPFNLAVFIQNHLRKVVLNLPSTEMYKLVKTVQSSRDDYIRVENDYDMVLLADEWRIRPHVLFVPGRGVMLLVCRYHRSRSDMEKLYLHLPRKPYHNLSPTQSDQLSYCVLGPRTCQPQKTGQYCSGWRMYDQHASYSGIDSFNISEYGNFCQHSVMLREQEALTVSCRSDINQLLDQFVAEGNISAAFAADVRTRASMFYPRASVKKYVQGATYVSLHDSMLLQETLYTDRCIEVVDLRTASSGNEEEATVIIHRSWPQHINIIQKEDASGYGYPFEAISRVARAPGRLPVMMFWTLMGCLTSCKELWRAVDSKRRPFRYDSWEGYMLTHLAHHYLTYERISYPRNTPFKVRKSSSQVAIMNKLLDLCPSWMAEFSGEYTEANAASYFMFDVEFWRTLFPSDDFDSISIHSRLADVTGSLSRVVIVVEQGVDDPVVGNTVYYVGGKTYELRCVTYLVPRSQVKSPLHFDAVRLVRHGGGLFSYWKQHRSSQSRQLVVQCSQPGRMDDVPLKCFARVLVYVQVDTDEIEEYRLAFHKHLGGQLKVRCGCNQYPLLVSPLPPRKKKKKEKAVSGDKKEGVGEKEEKDREKNRGIPFDIDVSLREHPPPPVTEDEDAEGKEEKPVLRCTYKECSCTGVAQFICANMFCHTRLCKQCFDGLKEGTVVDPPIVESDDMSDDKSGLSSFIVDDGGSESESDAWTEHVSVSDRDLGSKAGSASGHGSEDQSDNVSDCQGDAVITESGIRDDVGLVLSGCGDGGNGFGVQDCEDASSDEEETRSDDGIGAPMPISLRRLVMERHLRAPVSDGHCDDDCGVSDADGFFLEHYLVDSNYNPMDVTGESDLDGHVKKPTSYSNAGRFPYIIRARPGTRTFVPSHVLLNQVGSLCKRYSHRITGTHYQQNFVQRLVATVCGASFPLVYPQATCLPRHYYAEASCDPRAILGAVPLCCYTSTPKNPFGIASSLSVARNHVTHSSSSIGSCHTALAFDYDIQCNQVAGSLDSRLINKNGFQVDLVNQYGVSMRQEQRSDLSHGVDSHQTALNLSASAMYHFIDWFLTLTGCQATHPGLKHLFAHKEGLAWTRFIPRYQYMSAADREDVKRSFEQAYGTVVARCWLEVSRLVLQYLIASKDILGPVECAFWRYEYQEESGNLPHIHGLVGIKLENRDNEDELKRFIYDLQKCDVANLIPTSELQQYVDEGLFQSPTDWFPVTELGASILNHNRCTNRCIIIKEVEDGPDIIECKRLNIAAESTNPLQHEFKPFALKYLPAFVSVMKELGLYEEATHKMPRGRFGRKMFEPCRHLGRITPGCNAKMSPVISKMFAAFRSSQNAQVLTHTNGVARYLVKYVTNLDEANRVVMWANNSVGVEMHTENQFLHNTKISRSRQHEARSFERSRQRNHTIGHAVAAVEMLQHILGIPDIVSTMREVIIDTRPLEFRRTTKLKLDKRGNLEWPEFQDEDNEEQISNECVSEQAREERQMRRRVKPNQKLIYRENATAKKCSTKYDMVTQFGLRPVELLELFMRLGFYFRWFEVEKFAQSSYSVGAGMSDDIVKCNWYDGYGRRVLLRRSALGEVGEYLRTLSFPPHTDSGKLHRCLLNIVDHCDDREFRGKDDSYKRFVDDSYRGELPAPVYSSITPRDPVAFVQHIMLVLGEFETELDFTICRTLRESLVAAKLIGRKTTEYSLRLYSNTLLLRIIDEIMPAQPLSTRMSERYVIAAKAVLDGVILNNEIPIDELPPCLLTELYVNTEEEFLRFWEEAKKNQLSSIYSSVPVPMQRNLPSRESVASCTRNLPLRWDVLETFRKFDQQTVDSYREQRFAILQGKLAVDKYMIQVGEKANTCTRNVVFHGVPGSGKTYLAQLVSLYGISLGLRVMTTSMMGIRANVLGGIHYHRLFSVTTKSNLTPYRMAELAIDKLNRKKAITFLHAVMTMDLLIVDEAGQMSAQQFAALDVIFRITRDSKRPFGGVLVICAMDHCQFDPINGLPFLTSSFIYTMSVLVVLKHSVRAHADKRFRQLQDITRMNPRVLRDSPYLKARFEELARSVLTFVPSMNHRLIDPNTQKMFARRIPVQDAINDYIKSSAKRFDEMRPRVRYEISRADDYQQRAGMQEAAKEATSNKIIAALNKHMREPRELLFWKGGLYFATTNGEGFFHSQLMIMLEVPSSDTVRAKTAIPMFAAPPGYDLEKIRDRVPTRDELLNDGWTEVRISCAPQYIITVEGIQGFRQQYSLVHIGTSTINKQTGNTIPRCAIEFSNKKSCPWERPQIVVMLSRTRLGRDTIIVGLRAYAIKRMWEIITTGNHWTDYIEHLLDTLSVSGLDDDAEDERSQKCRDVFNYADTFPFRMSGSAPPNDWSGFVYCIASVIDVNRCYIGQAESLSERLDDHNNGNGADCRFAPYFTCAYICGLSHMNRNQRMYLESEWKRYVRLVMSQGRTDLMTRIEQGRRVVENYNSQHPKNIHIRFVVTVSRRTLGLL